LGNHTEDPASYIRTGRRPRCSASRIVAIGRHPKPSTTPDIIRTPNSNISIDQA
jgi:hypothetical protein